jgi:hypothetical protein
MTDPDGDSHVGTPFAGLESARVNVSVMLAFGPATLNVAEPNRQLTASPTGVTEQVARTPTETVTEPPAFSNSTGAVTDAELVVIHPVPLEPLGTLNWKAYSIKGDRAPHGQLPPMTFETTADTKSSRFPD